MNSSRRESIHITRLANKGCWSPVRRIQYKRPKAPKEKDIDVLLDAQPDPSALPFIFAKSFRHCMGGRTEFGLSRRGKKWYFHLKHADRAIHHRLSKLTHVTFYGSQSVKLARNKKEYIYLTYFQPNSLAYRALYHALQTLIVKGILPHISLTPWIAW